MSQTPEDWLSTPADLENPIEDVGDGVGIVSPGAPFAGEVYQHDQRIRAVIVRGCPTCGEKRTLQADGTAVCAQGHTAGDVIDVGLINAHYEDALKQKAWDLVGRRLATRRIKKANARLP